MGGGSPGWGSHPHGYLDNLYPAENPKRNRIVFDGLPNEHNRKSKSRRDRKHEGKRANSEVWRWEDESTLVRVHNEPRRKLFIPKEAEHLPCSLKRIKDDRTTRFQSNTRTITDSWRLVGNNVKNTN